MLITDMMRGGQFISEVELRQQAHHGFKNTTASQFSAHFPLLVYMSGHTENTIVRQGILKEDIYFIHKPISPKALAKTMRRMFDE